ncbi:glycine/D-amino acid oxidase-like deaminating enzyme [Hoeflea marina]|uniref:Glycine/D-amino acid oxidase-like deaminating enzyme n=1 Tax=Hoeflea marina TaxID=274592 RepID=A0A317PMM8_9HYPH|nr:FAD-binding oxidoreductase [Hoeflea marina]PWW00307.1 glycine/D-amino acid oxidase-like deaminating enzyme [Hoeflea marina]
MLAPAPRKVTIIGAGIVGLATALTLQSEGHDVTLIDPRPPGSATSFGNAGAIVSGGVVPTATPGLWKRVPTMLLDPMSPLRIRWSYLPRLAPWLIRFLDSGREHNALRISRELSTLTAGCLEAHHRLADLAGARHILKPVGWLKVYRDEDAYAGTAYDRGLMDLAGVSYQHLEADELHQLEPGISRDFTVGLFQPDAAFVSTPYALSQALFSAFTERGGVFHQEAVRRFDFGDDGQPSAVVTTHAIHPLDTLVIAAGAWSKELARQLGSTVSLDTERGYHLSFARTEAGPVLNRPTVFGGPQFVLSPMADGIRLNAGVELAGLDAEPDFTRIKALVPLARKCLPGLSGEITREWMGYRPSTPDSKPVIGRSPVHANVLYAFGHGHMGLGLSAITGRLIADLVAGRESRIQLAPFAVDRF